MKSYHYNKNKKGKNKFYILLISLVVVFILFFYLFKSNMSNLLTYISYPYIYISDFFGNFKNNKNLIQENSDLLKENQILKIEQDKNKVIKKELETLKKILDLKNIYTNYELVTSTVISKNKDSYFNTIIIDKGKDYGIKNDFAVVSSNGLIGKVIEVYDKTSLVKLITSNDKISVKLNDNEKDYYGMLNNFKNNRFILENLENNKSIKEGSKVYTTGYGVFPEGIYIGKITKEDYLYVEIENLNDLKYVLVLGNTIND